MQHAILDRKAVRPSVRLSVKRVNCDKTNESSAGILIAYERPMHLVFRHEKWLMGGWEGRPLTEILGQSDPPASKTVTSNRHSLIAPKP